MSEVVPRPGAEAARLAVLREYQILDTPREAVYDDLTRLAAEICSTPVALMTLVDERRQWFKSTHGLGIAETPREWSFCAHAMLEDDLLVVHDATADERFARNPYVTGEPHVRFYAGAPLRAPEGHPLGALSVIDKVPRELSSRQAAALRALGREAQAQMDRRRAEFLRDSGALELALRERALRESEERFRALVELSADAIVLMDPAGVFRFASASTERVVGYPPSELIGRSVFDLIHRDDLKHFQELFEHGLEHPGKPAKTEFRIPHRDGTWRVIEADGVNRLHDPAVAGMVANFRDITERRRAEEAVRASEELFRQLADNVDAVFWLRTVNPPRLLYVSPMCERVFGRSPESFGGNPLSFVEGVHPEDRERLAAAFTHEEAYDHEYRIVDPGGAIRWIHSRGFRVPGKDEVVIAGISQDVTEAKHAEEELRAQSDLVANLLAVARATTETPDLDKTLRNALDVMCSITGAEGGSLFLLDEDGTLTAKVFGGGRLFQPAQPDEAALVLDQGLAGWVARRRQPALVPDTRQDQRWVLLPGENAANTALSALAIPVVSGGSLTGVLTLLHSLPGHFTERHLDLVQAAGEQLALALRNAQFIDALGRLAGRQRILNDVLRAAGSRLDPDQALKRAVNAMARRTGWHSIHIGVPSDDRTHFKVRASTLGLAGDEALPLSQGVVGRAFASGQTQIVSDVTRDPDYFALAQGVKSELAVPIRHGDRTLGVLNIESDRLQGFGPEDVRLAESLSDAVGLALANASLHRAVAAEGERLSSLIAASRDGVLLAGPDGTVHVMNEPARRLLGLAGVAPTWLGRPVALVAERLRQSGALAAADVLAALPTPGGRETKEAEFESPAGIVRLFSQPVTSQGSPVGQLLVLRDVTEERRVERLREDLSHTMVHDLRSPLTSILGSLDILSRSGEGRDRDLLEIASRAARKLLALVDAILDVSRLEKGAMPLRLVPVDVTRLVADVIQLQGVKAGEEGIEITREIPAGLPPMLADLDLVTRVLQNLLGNALKFGGRKVRVSAGIEDAGRSVRISVEDDGPGVPAELLSRIFEKFVTGEHKKRGSGLGLAFCKLAAEAHGGRVRVESGPGGGAAFSLTLPAAL